MKFKQTINLRLTLDPTSFNTIIPLPALPTLPTLPQGYSLYSQSLEITNFKAYAKISSLPVAQLPDFTLTDSETDKLYKSLDLEWQSARKQLNLLFGSGNYQICGSVSLLNPAGYPYRIYDLLQLYNPNGATIFGVNNNFALQIQDVGWGVLTGNDIVSIWCDIIQTIWLAPPQINVTNNVNPTISVPSGGSGSGGTTIIDDEYMPLIPKNVSFTCEISSGYLLQSSTEDAPTATMPSNPSPGDVIGFVSESTTQWKIDFNGKTYQNNSTYTYVLIPNGSTGGKFYYDGTAWYAYPSAPSFITPVIPTGGGYGTT